MSSGEGDVRTSDGPEGGSASSILLLMEREENRRVLAEWLGQQYQVIEATSTDALESDFDLCIIDRPAIGTYGDALAERRTNEQPVILPVLFVVPGRELERMGPDIWKRIDAVVRERVDELITTPIKKAELRGRIENLLNKRELSLRLREQREQYRQLLSVAPVAIATLVEDDVAFVNERGAELLGADAPIDLIGESLLPYVHEDDREAVRDILGWVVTEQEDSAYVDCRIVVDDLTRYVELAGVPITYEGQPAVQVVLRDVTDRREREREVERQRDRLVQLNRLNEVIRGIDQSLVRSESRDDIEAAVCERLVDAAGLRLAWIGRMSAGSEDIEKSAAAGDAIGYLDAIEPSANVDEIGGNGPAGETVRTHEVQVVDDVFEHPAFEPWYDVAREEDVASCISVPLLYGDTLYGILVVYADEVGAFDADEQAVLGELGETIAHAINAAESRRALVTDRIYELDFAIRDDGHFLSRVTAEHDVAFELEGLVSGQDGYLKYLIAETDDPELVLDEASAADDVAHVRLVTESDEEAMFEFVFEHDLVTQTFGTLGATVQAMRIEEGRFDVTAEVPYSTDISSFVASVESKHPDVSLLAQRESERPLQTRQEAWQAFEESLTDRQWAALQTAYYAGFFDWPRGSTGEEVAESLDISASTFHEHLRSAQRKLLEVLFED